MATHDSDVPPAPPPPARPPRLTQHCWVVSSHVVLPHVSVVDVPPLLELLVEPLELPLLVPPVPELVPPLPELPVPELVPPLPELVPPLPDEVAPPLPPLVDPELAPLLVPELPELAPPLLAPLELAPSSPGTSSEVAPPQPTKTRRPAQAYERGARRASFM